LIGWRGHLHSNMIILPDSAKSLLARIHSREARVGVIGLGYVGLPLACAIGKQKFWVIGFDIDHNKTVILNEGRSYLSHVSDNVITTAVTKDGFTATNDFSRIAEVDIVLICVPTPLDQHREPDLSHVTKTAESIAPFLKSGHLIVLESSTYPGTTRDVMLPILEQQNLKSGVDYFLAYSPEREDPGNPKFNISHIPKVIGGHGQAALHVAQAFYDQVVQTTVPMSSLEAAEAVKLTENIFRSVNIALVNELKLIYQAMGIDIWEVISGAATKPFGFMPFYPGPGLGGHCIPVDPFYLTWKAREYDVPTKFVELAGEINSAMPFYVVERLAWALSEHSRIALNGARVLIIGIAYKKNVDDTRESPAFSIMETLEKRGAATSYHDPFVRIIPPTRKHSNLAGRKSVSLSSAVISAFDVVLICTDHDGVDYEEIVKHASLIVDTRNVCARCKAQGAHIVKA
jgi:UDP-N-acetyl-D-glucosamine dehydrogenase